MMPMSSPGWFNDLPEYMTEAEYRDLSEEISRAIEIDAFVDPAQIDPIFYDRTYLLAPDEGGAHGYALLAAAMEARRLVAIARLTLRGRLVSNEVFGRLLEGVAV